MRLLLYNLNYECMFILLLHIIELAQRIKTNSERRFSYNKRALEYHINTHLQITKLVAWCVKLLDMCSCDDGYKVFVDHFKHVDVTANLSPSLRLLNNKSPVHIDAGA